MSADHPTPPRRLRAAVYLRMSTLRQEDSPERQIGQCVPYVEQRGYTLVKDPRDADYPYKDLGICGDDERAGFDRLLAAAQAGLIDVIVCDEWSRLSRQDEDDFVAEVRRPLRRAGVKLDTVKEGLQDWDSISGRIMGEIHAGQARSESVNIGRRVHSSARTRVMQGLPAGGGTPFGYRWEYEVRKAGGKEKRRPVRLVPDGCKADVVRTLFELYASGTYKIEGLVEHLEKSAVPPPRSGHTGKQRWNRPSVRAVLKNDVYTGRYDYGRQTASKHTAVENGVVVPKKGPSKPAGRKSVPITSNPEEVWVVSPNLHEALISQDLYDRVQARLQKNREGRRAPDPDGYILSGLLVCGHCGRTLNGHRYARTGVLEYRCPSRDAGEEHPCKNARVRQDQLLNELAERLERSLTFADAIKAALGLIERKEREQRKLPDVGPLKKEIGDLEARIRHAEGNLIEMETEEIPLGRQRIKDLKAKRDELAERLEDMASGKRLARLASAIRAMQEGLWKLREAVRKQDWQEFRRVIEPAIASVAVRWEVRPSKTGNQRYRHRIPTGGVVHLTESATRICDAYSEEFRDLLSAPDMNDARAVICMASMIPGFDVGGPDAVLVSASLHGTAEFHPGVHNGSRLCTPGASRRLAIPFSLLAG